MRIIYHHRTQGKGVEGIHIRSIVQALRDLGHEVRIICPPGCDPTGMTRHRGGGTPGFWRIAFSFLSRHAPEALFECVELLYNIPAFLKMRKALEENPVDFIYERYFLFSLATRIASKKYGIPVVYEINDSSFVPRLRPLRLVRLANRLEKNALSAADALLVVSGQFRERLIQHGLPSHSMKVVHNAIDPGVFDPARVVDISLGIPTGRFVIGFVGLFVRWVGLERLIRLFKTLQSGRPETHLLLVGGGPEEASVRHSVREAGLEKHVTLTGAVPHEDIPSYIGKMDVCVIPKHEEYTSPVKLFEYMGMGKAVLVPDYASLKEIVEHGKNGILFDPEDERSFVSSMERLMDDRDLLLSLGRQARRDVLDRHTWRENALRIVDLVSSSSR